MSGLGPGLLNPARRYCHSKLLVVRPAFRQPFGSPAFLSRRSFLKSRSRASSAHPTPGACDWNGFATAERSALEAFSSAIRIASAIETFGWTSPTSSSSGSKLRFAASTRCISIAARPVSSTAAHFALKRGSRSRRANTAWVDTPAALAEHLTLAVAASSSKNSFSFRSPQRSCPARFTCAFAFPSPSGEGPGVGPAAASSSSALSRPTRSAWACSARSQFDANSACVRRRA